MHCVVLSYCTVEDQVDFLVRVHHIYMMRDGRINVCGITTRNINYVAAAFHEAVTNIADRKS